MTDERGARLYVRPTGIVPGPSIRFEALDPLRRDTGSASRRPVAASALDEAGRAAIRCLEQRVQAPRPPICGLSFGEPRIMGILNVTPDSFSDGGEHDAADAAIAHGKRLVAAGADLIDVGGESTRPGAEPPTEAEELRRVLPVVKALARDGVILSIDTRRAAVMAAALEAGARIVNDISALRADPTSLAVVAASGAPVVLMHMQGEPQMMQRAPTYVDAPLDVYDFLRARIAACDAAGIATERVIVDPGIGFGKTVAHNLEILADLALFHGLGVPLMVGASRKGFIGRLTGETAARARLPGSLAAALHALDLGVHILRVHDVAETRQAVAVWQALRSRKAGHETHD